jgi:hypothetical protein
MDIASLSSASVISQPTGSLAGRAVGSSASSSGSSATSTSANTAGTDSPRVAASYISPSLSYDPTTHLLITQYRDTETGKVRLQIPAEKVVDAYRKIAAYGAAAIPNAAGVTAPVSGTNTSTNTATTAGGLGLSSTNGATSPWGITGTSLTTGTISGVAVKTAAFESSAALMASLPPTAMASQLAQTTLGTASGSVSASLGGKGGTTTLPVIA